MYFQLAFNIDCNLAHIPREYVKFYPALFMHQIWFLWQKIRERFAFIFFPKQPFLKKLSKRPSVRFTEHIIKRWRSRIFCCVKQRKKSTEQTFFHECPKMFLWVLKNYRQESFIFISSTFLSKKTTMCSLCID